MSHIFTTYRVSLGTRVPSAIRDRIGIEGWNYFLFDNNFTLTKFSKDIEPGMNVIELKNPYGDILWWWCFCQNTGYRCNPAQIVVANRCDISIAKLKDLMFQGSKSKKGLALYGELKQDGTIIFE